MFNTSFNTISLFLFFGTLLSVFGLLTFSYWKLKRTLFQEQEKIKNQTKTQEQDQSSLQNLLLKLHQQQQTQIQTLEKEVRQQLEASLHRVDDKLTESLKEGFRHFEKVQDCLKGTEMKLASLNQMGQSIFDLNQLLKLPHFRGTFGEFTLEKLLADFLPLGKYEFQYTIDPHSQERVDAIIRLAENQILPIDSKFPRESILPLFTSQNPKDLELARKKLLTFVKAEAKAIAEKYIRPEYGTLEMAFLFLPSETLYFEVVREGELFEMLCRLKVFPVSPNTLAISLKSISIAQEYYEMAKGVEGTLLQLKHAQRAFSLLDQKMEHLGQSLRKSEEAFQSTQKHWKSYEKEISKLGDKIILEQPFVLK